MDFCTDLQPVTDAGSRVLKVEPTAGDSDGGEPPLNEDDDDEVDDNDQGDEEPQTEHLVLAQFDKVDPRNFTYDWLMRHSCISKVCRRLGKKICEVSRVHLLLTNCELSHSMCLQTTFAAGNV